MKGIKIRTHYIKPEIYSLNKKMKISHVWQENSEQKVFSFISDGKTNCNYSINCENNVVNYNILLDYESLRT